VAVVGVPSIALARDHLELVCSGVAKAKDGGDRIPLFFHLFESRASDGSSRDEWLSTIYQGQLFQAHYLNKGSAAPRPIELSHDGKTRFKGTYVFDNKVGTAPFTMHVVGKVNDDPSAAKKVYRDVDETLACVDLSI
jgi:hypothetical protein